MPAAQYQSTSMGAIVNGGLIDFHDAVALQAAQYPQQPYQTTLAALQQQYAPNAPQYAQSAPPPAQGQCVAGPPSFLHINGQVYKPVLAAEVEPPPVAPAAAPEPAVKAKPPQKNIEREIERRVAAKVDEFMTRATMQKATTRARANTKGASDRIRELNAEMRRTVRASR
jgi:hypothetical protein